MKLRSKSLHVDQFPFLPALAALMIRGLHGTCRKTVLGQEHLDDGMQCGGPVLFTAWHFAFPAIIHFFRDTGGMLMVSRSRDGEWIARTLHHLGYRAARGSAGKGEAAALRQILSYLREGPGGGFIADGSQGPARVAQKGILLVARYAQAPLVPVSMAASPCWRFRSWDRTMLAKPFSHIVYAFGAPLWVDRNASPEQMENYRQELEDRLNQLTREAKAAANGAHS